MAGHLETGKKGEELAVQFLHDRGWKILERNWRSGHREIDIIAETGGKLVIVEVKVRKFIGTERLEEHIPRTKQRFLIRAAAAYLEYRGLDTAVRFDVILLTGEGDRYRLEHIEDAFGPWD
jgi:putative endonuclease